VIGCCEHSDEWHRNNGCEFPGCGCRRRILRRKAAPARLTTCSECLQQPTRDGAGHDDGCTRTGFGPDVVAASSRSLLR
jgi:hypothetical protein